MDRVTDETLDNMVVEVEDGVPAAFVADDVVLPMVWTSDRIYVPPPYEFDDDTYVR
jgi:hypothetical protein